MHNEANLALEMYQSPIDLVECGRRHPKKVAAKSFANHVVSLADDVIHTHMPMDELVGIRKCVNHLLRRLEWNEGFRVFPFRKQSYRDSSFKVEGREFMLADSVILTTLVYRTSLDEGVTGLRSIIFGEFVQGLEWICSAAIRTSRLDDVATFPVLESPEIAKYVWGRIPGL